MDPNACLATIRSLTKAIDAGDADADGCADELVEHFRGLDEWLSKGGFLPDAWRTK